MDLGTELVTEGIISRCNAGQVEADREWQRA